MRWNKMFPNMFISSKLFDIFGWGYTVGNETVMVINFAATNDSSWIWRQYLHMQNHMRHSPPTSQPSPHPPHPQMMQHGQVSKNTHALFYTHSFSYISCHRIWKVLFMVWIYTVHEIKQICHTSILSFIPVENKLH